MTKKKYILIPIFLYFVLTGATVGETGEIPSLHPERIILNLTQNPAHEQAITWMTEAKLEKPAVEVARSRNGVDLESYSWNIPAESEPAGISDSETAWFYSTVIRSLDPETTYNYRVGSENNWSEWSSFTTAGDSFEPFTLVYMGDPQVGLQTYVPRLFRQALRSAPDARIWLFCGDQVNVGDSDKEFGEFFAAGSWMFRSINILPVAGNHEYPRAGLLLARALTPLWRLHYTLPENGPAGLEETCYFVDYQEVKFIVLNGSEKLEAQRDWLETVLRSNTAIWTIVAIHQPIYSTGNKRDNPELQELFLPLFDRYGVDLVLQGHDHTYGRTYPLKEGKIVSGEARGTVYVVSSSGEKFYTQNPLYLELMAKTVLDTQLFQVISFEKNVIHFKAVTATGGVIDEFTVRK